MQPADLDLGRRQQLGHPNRNSAVFQGGPEHVVASDAGECRCTVIAHLDQAFVEHHGSGARREAKACILAKEGKSASCGLTV